jgi:hypothetical protein
MIRQRKIPFPSRRAAAVAGVVSLGVLAVWAGVALTPAPPAVVSRGDASADAHLDKAPPRKVTGLVWIKNGLRYNCMECHASRPARWHYSRRPFVEHAPIRLEHGNNRFCLNCHHPTNRNVFVDYDGSEIPATAVDQLCGKCHGTIHREWEAGVHGRRNGHWDTRRGRETRLVCIQCHDPHDPAFKPLPPLPPLRYPARAYNSMKSDPHASAGAHE